MSVPPPPPPPELTLLEPRRLFPPRAVEPPRVGPTTPMAAGFSTSDAIAPLALAFVPGFLGIAILKKVWLGGVYIIQEDPTTESFSSYSSVPK